MAVFFEEDEKDQLKAIEIMEKLAELYNIPFFTIENILEDLKKEDETLDLVKDLGEEIEAIEEYIKNGEFLPLNESTKVLYRAIKWRLSSNDAKNRGYIFYNFPKLTEDFEKIFKKCNLRRKKPKKKPVPKKPDPEEEEENREGKEEGEDQQENEGENEDQKDENQEENEDKGSENQDQDEEGEENPEENGSQANNQEEEEPAQEEEEEPEEEEPEEEEPEERDLEEEEGEGPKFESFLPETFFHFKSFFPFDSQLFQNSITNLRIPSPFSIC